MTEPTVTQTVAALAERLGAGAVAFALLRRYWKPVLGTLGVAISIGKIIQQGEDARDKLVKIEAAQASQADRLTHLESDWGALFSAAHITVTPNTPAAIPAAPPSARKPRNGREH